VEVPANTTATVFMPANTSNEITESGKPISSMKEIKVSGIENNSVILQIGSGRYLFSAKSK
jgi:alpha-L-rhamnosidase